MKLKIYHLFSIVILLSVVLFSVFSVAGQKRTSNLISKVKNNATVAALVTAKPYFSAGESVSVTGSGYNKAEQVNVIVEQGSELPQAKAVMATWVIFADENGNLNFDWQIPYSGKFSISAVGSESGQSAQITVVTPINVPGNPSCATLNSSVDPAFAHITSDYGFKIEPPVSTTLTLTDGPGRSLTGGAPADSANSVTTFLQTEKILDWSSTRLLTAVILKNGSTATVFPSNPESLNDSGLDTGTRNAISHIEFCFNSTASTSSITIIKDAQPNSPQTFNFEATGQVNQDFGLVDNGVVGPDRITFNNLTKFGAGDTVTVSETPSGGSYSLVQISCTSSGGVNNNVTNVPSRFVQIFLEPGEDVTCTFVNAVTTAAYVSLSGRVASESGRGLGRVSVTMQNTNTWETQTVQTNSFGRYQFDNLPAGTFYIVTVSSKKHSFHQNTLSLVLDDFRENVDFTALTR